MNSRRLAILGALVALFAGLAEAQLPRRFELQPPPTPGSTTTIMEWFAIPGGDVNADGRPDVIAVGEDAYGSYPNRYVHVFTAEDGSHVASYLVDDAAYGSAHQGSFDQGLRRWFDGGGDFDGDGHSDMILANPVYGAGGWCWLVNGATGTTTLAAYATDYGELCGYYVTFLGDVSGDGKDEFAVSSPGHQEPDWTFQNPYLWDVGRIWVYTANSSGYPVPLWSQAGVDINDNYGDPMLDFGDQNGDGKNDLLVGTDSRQTMLVLSGVDGSLIRTLPTAQGTIDVIGDLNGDGRREYTRSHSLASVFTVDVRSGLDDSILASYSGGYDFAVRASGDVDGDGHDDYVVRYRDSQTAEFRSGADHSLIESISLPNFLSSAGSIAIGDLGTAVGDVNGDGFADFSFWSPLDQSSGGIVPARLEIHSLAGERRYGEGLGGTQTLDLEWLPPTSGDPALGAIRCSGAAPGALGLATVSLAPASYDYLGLQVLVDPNPGNLVAQLGFGFDLAGQITTPGDLRSPWVAGTTFYFQFFSTWPGYACSNGQELRFTR